MKQIIIGLTGRAGAGKSTVAEIMRTYYAFERRRFAGPLKAMLKALGLTDRQLDGDQKEVPCALLGGKTPRWAMQSLGTEWGRNQIDKDLWLRALLRDIENRPKVVIDDVRFVSEAAAIWAAGGVIWRVNRDGETIGDSHPSEQDYKSILPDCVIDNNGSKEELPSRILQWAV